VRSERPDEGAPAEAPGAAPGAAPIGAPNDASAETSAALPSGQDGQDGQDPVHPVHPVDTAPAPSEVPAGVLHVAREPADAAAPPVPPSAPAEPPPAPPQPPAFPPVVEVDWLDWDAVRAAVDPRALRARLRDTVERMEALLDRDGGPALLFDEHRAHPEDRAIRVAHVAEDAPLWFVGDLHGDLLALEATLALAREVARAADPGRSPRLVLLGDLFDDGGFGLETLLRVFELVLDQGGDPHVCLLAGNHDEALGYDGARFTATVSPSDFADFLNRNLAHEWLVRAGKLAVRLFANAPRALFFPDGLLVAHGGFPLVDLHPMLDAGGDWNDPRCLTDFVWTRAHPKARKKLPNRSTRGSSFGHEDFAAFCALAARRGRPVTHMVRGHDHLEERWAVWPAYAEHPLLTTNAMSRRLAREAFGPYERVPTVARWVPGALPQLHRLHVPAPLVRALYPEEEPGG
jgi:hypothetical protein